MENGKVKTLMIPKEKDGAGWSNFYVHIKGFFDGGSKNEANKVRIKDVCLRSRESKEPGLGENRAAVKTVKASFG